MNAHGGSGFVAEERIAVQHAENELSDFVATWQDVPIGLRPTALRFALLALVILFLDHPIRAEIFLRDVSRAAELPKSEMRQLIQRRADICRNYKELWKRKSAAVEQEVLSWML